MSNKIKRHNKTVLLLLWGKNKKITKYNRWHQLIVLVSIDKGVMWSVSQHNLPPHSRNTRAKNQTHTIQQTATKEVEPYYPGAWQMIGQVWLQLTWTTQVKPIRHSPKL